MMICPSCHKDISECTSFCGSCGAVLLQPEDAWNFPAQAHSLFDQDLKRGTVLSQRYEIIEELGQGSTGRVFRAFDSFESKEVALKLLNPEMLNNRENRDRFRSGLESAQKINHENIRTIYGSGQESGACFVTMEYVPGQDLKKLTRQAGQLALPTAIGLAKQLCQGLAAAHRSGLVHGDLKPGHIVIDREGCARILDFGMRSARVDPEYMSPEQSEGTEADLRADIYSLGIIVYEILAGCVPFQGDSSLGLAVKHKTVKPRSPVEFNPSIPEKLERIIFKCLEKEREKRYASAGDVFADLERLGLDKSALSRNFSSRKIRGPFSGIWLARPFRLFLWAVLVIVAVAAASLLFFQKTDLKAFSDGMKMLVVIPFENLGPPEDEYFSDGLSDEIMSRLAALKELGVISRTSAFQYKKTDKTVKRIGEELGVDFILEGSVRWSRDPDGFGRVRVTAQLIRVADDIHLWAENYEREIEDIFAVQAEIADQVIKKLDIAILEPERLSFRENPTENLDAFDAYLRAKTAASRAYIEQDEQEYDRAIGLLNTAIGFDPQFLQAYLVLFDTQMQLYLVGLDRSEARLNGIRETLSRVEELAPASPEVQMIQGLYYLWIQQDHQRAMEMFTSVQNMRPNLSPSYLASVKRLRGEWEGCIADYERAFQLNPLDPDLAHVLGRCYAWINDYQKAEEWFDRALSIYPDLYYSRLGKARLPLLARGNLQETRILLEGLPDHVLTEFNLYELGLLEGNYEGILVRLLASPFQSFSESQFYIPRDLALASVYSAMGDQELKRAHANRAAADLEKKEKENPDDTRFIAALGLAYAYSGNGQAAVREGERAAGLFPLSKDAFEGPRYILNLAKIYALAGEPEQALDRLEYLFSIPCGNIYSQPLLKLDPVWDSLRGHPRFQRLSTASIHGQDN